MRPRGHHVERLGFVSTCDAARNVDAVAHAALKVRSVYSVAFDGDLEACGIHWVVPVVNVTAGGGNVEVVSMGRLLTP